MSKDLKKGRLGQNAASKRKRLIVWAITAAALSGGAYTAYQYTGTTKVEFIDANGRMPTRCLAIDLSGLPRLSQGSCT